LIAVDTNILVYAHRPEFQLHEPARAALQSLASGPRSWAIVVHCLVEFTGAVSHPGRFRQPSSYEQITHQIDAWRESPTLVLLPDSTRVLDHFLSLVRQSRVGGAAVHDARIAAACLAGGVRELWTCDRDYGRFPELKTRNPLV